MRGTQATVVLHELAIKQVASYLATHLQEAEELKEIHAVVTVLAIR